MLPKMKRKYLVNNTEYYGIDNISEFISLLGKYDKTNEIVKALHNVATTIKNEKDLKIVEEAITKHIIYNNNGGMYRENGKDYLVHNIITYKMPKDLEKAILEVSLMLNSKTIDENANNQSLLSSFEK